MYKVKKVGVWSVAKTSAIISFFIGLVFAVFFFLFSTIVLAALSTSFGDQASSLVGLGMAPIVGISISYPFILALSGLIWGAIGALFYNLSSAWFGPVEIEIEEAQMVQGAQTSQENTKTSSNSVTPS